MNTRRFILLIALLPLTGCIPFPHTSERFPAMDGKIVDATTGQPIRGAVVAVQDHPRTKTKTDAGGRFHFSKHRNYHLILIGGPCASDWPEGVYWSEKLDVSHPGYEPREVDAAKEAFPQSCDDMPLKLRDILLTPKL